MASNRRKQSDERVVDVDVCWADPGTTDRDTLSLTDILEVD